jgi:RimJ/RimL family protein N-acetyltransferase
MIFLKPFDLQSAAEMVKLFSSDNIVRKELGLEKKEYSPKEEYKFVTDWCAKTNSLQFVIRYGDEFAGMISLSHIDKESGTARVGYWIGSEFRNKGVCSEAFRLILELAKNEGIKEVRSDIDKDNLYSLRIWQKYHPSITEKNKKQVTVMASLFRVRDKLK